jgi:CheY-like chemotaxis protein
MQAMRSPAYGGPGIVQTFRTSFLSKTGERIPVAISGTIIHDDAGAEDGTIGFAKDLRELLHKEELATLGEVAMGLSHEIGNPLAVVVNQLELLERDVGRLAGEGDCAVEHERIDAIRREIRRITDVLDRVGEMVESETYETVSYVGPQRMIDLRRPELRDYAADSRLRGLRILVVDDDAGICNTLSELLGRDGCEVECAADGEEALDKLRQRSFDVVLSDVVMPRMDGYQLYSTLKEKWPDLPVIMMTAFHYDRDHVIKRSRMKGLKGVIFKKPVDPSRLRSAIAESVEAARRRKP